MVLEVTEMGAWLEIVPPAVGDDAGVKDVDFPDAPAIESRLEKEVFEDTIRADLHIANSSAEAAYAQTTRD